MPPTLADRIFPTNSLTFDGPPFLHLKRALHIAGRAANAAFLSAAHASHFLDRIPDAVHFGYHFAQKTFYLDLDRYVNHVLKSESMAVKTYSTGEVAKLIGVSRQTVQAWIAKRAVAAPKPGKVGRVTVRLWNGADIKKLRKFKEKSKAGQR
jgi:excisionase family DNA binding protein